MNTPAQGKVTLLKMLTGMMRLPMQDGAGTGAQMAGMARATSTSTSDSATAAEVSRTKMR